MNYRVRIESSGWAAPESGPARNRYLRENGERLIEGVRAAFNAVVEVVGSIQFPEVVASNDRREFEASVSEARAHWREIKFQYAEVIESQLREPIEVMVENAKAALNFLEDTELCDEAHGWLHLAGRLRFGFLGCVLRAEAGVLKTDCPVLVGHQRWGISPELVTEWACSICRRRPDTCPHITDEKYDVVIDRSGTTCNACFAEDCDHQHGEVVQRPAHNVAVSFQVIAIAIVARPRDPLARVQDFSLGSVSDPELLALAEAGELYCSACLLPCQGFHAPEGLN